MKLKAYKTKCASFLGHPVGLFDWQTTGIFGALLLCGGDWKSDVFPRSAKVIRIWMKRRGGVAAGVWAGDPGGGILDEGAAAHIHGTHQRLLRLGSLHSDRCRLRHHRCRFAWMSLYLQRISGAALHREFSPLHAYSLSVVDRPICHLK